MKDPVICSGATIQVSFGPGVGGIHLTNVSCQGDERRLADCPAITTGSELVQCSHTSDASLRCLQAQTSTKFMQTHPDTL